MNLAGIVAFLLVMLTASPGVAQAVSSGDLQRFVGEYTSPFRSTTSTDWDDLLYLSATSARTPERVIAEFARRIGTSPAMAREYASVILDAALPDDACGVQPRPAPCVFAPGQRRYERAASMAEADRSGNLLIALGKSIKIGQEKATLLTLIGSHPSAPSIFARLSEQSPGPALLLAAGASGAMTSRLAQLAAARHSFYSSSGSTTDRAWQQALLESVEVSAAEAGASPRTRAALAHLALSWKLKSGLVEEAVASYYAYPAGVRALLRLPVGCEEMGEFRACGDAYWLSDELGAALWLTGHKDDARRWIRKYIMDFGVRSFRTRGAARDLQLNA